VLLGDSGKAERVLGWRARVSFAELVAMMVDADLVLAKRERALAAHDAAAAEERLAR
jgi:GDPmannose 4,6-dehydratase